MIDQSHSSFAADYNTARTLFRSTATACGASLEAVEHPERGPDGKRLFTDVARLGPTNAKKWLLLISGTHGIEGFCGSGAQIDLLRRGELNRLPDDTGALIVHAINPHGFAWLRRFTHENVDLNRNWIDFDKDLPRNDGYAEIAGALCPNEWNEESKAKSDAVLQRFAQERGFSAFVHAVSAGQYQYGTGLFFGGNAPTWSRATQTAIITDYLAKAASVVAIDFHTGLGPAGYGEPIVSQPRDTDQFVRARAAWGSAVTSIADGSSASTMVAGDGNSAMPALLPSAEVTAMALEFGTVAPDVVLEALRGDAWLHHHGDPMSEVATPIKAALRDAFYVDREDWRGMVMGQSLRACRQALSFLKGA